MNFKNAKAIMDTIHAGDDAEWVRSRNRATIDQLMNGEPPADAQMAQKMNMIVRVNWGEGPVTIAHARRQYYSAFLRPGQYFKVSIPDAPSEKSASWATFVTNYINRLLKRSRKQYEGMKSKFSQVVVHGIGPVIWDGPEAWCPRTVAIEDLRVPTDTFCSMENLEWFAERRAYTVTELTKRYEKGEEKGWKRDRIRKLLSHYETRNFEETNFNWSDQPEKMVELIKQNGHYFSGDAVPTIPLWNVRFRDGDSWRLRVLPCKEAATASQNEFLFDDGNTEHGRNLEQILQIQFGDLSNKAPFRYHSVRSLGFLLYEPCFWMNMARCRYLQHTFEQFNTLFRTTDPAGRARAATVELFDRGIIPEGVSIVRREERHNIEPRLVESCLAQLKQLINEGSTSYTQNVDTGTAKEQTAYETAVKVSMVNAMSQGLLQSAFTYETFTYTEQCRRLTLRGSEDKDAQQFQQACREFGIPIQFVDSRLWDIDPVIPIGSGNPVEEQTLIRQLMEARTMFPPKSQQIILNKFADIITKDPRLANELVPLDQEQEVNDSQSYAAFSFPILMHGIPVAIKPNLNLIDQIEILLGMVAGVIGRAQQSGGNAEPKDIIGFATVAKQIQEMVNLVGQDPSQAERVRGYQEALKDLLNLVKGFQQRASEKAQSEEAKVSPESQAKLAEMAAKTHLDIQLKSQKAQQDQDLAAQRFALDEQRKDAQLEAEIERDNLKASTEAVKAAQPPVKSVPQ